MEKANCPSNPTTIYYGNYGSNEKQRDLELGHTSYVSSPLNLKLSEVDSYIRNDFIKKVYTLLTLQLSLTWAMTYLVFRNQGATDYVNTHSTTLILAIIGTFVSLFAAFCYGSRHPHGILILFVFTLCESYCVTYTAIHYTAESVLLAWGLTASIFFFLTAYVWTTKSDFNYLGAVLYSSLWALLVGGIIQWLFLPNNQWVKTTLAVLGAIVASGYILYDTSDLMLRMTPDDVVLACLNLYLDVLLLFTKILQLIGDRNE